jgi:LmbE family N-acetylglucosaminyl deacetylase
MNEVMKSKNKYQVLVVVAHPDDESFGLGAVILWLRRKSVPVSALVFTQGEASTLGNASNQSELRARRCEELACASRLLGLARFDLYSYDDRHLNEVPLEERVQKLEKAGPAGVVLAFDETGITGHQDHIAATEAAETFAIDHGLSLYLWTLPEEVANALNKRFKTSFQGRSEDEIALTLNVAQERDRQWQAICCHQSQASGLNVVRARLELLCDKEYLVEWYRGTRGLDPFCQSTGGLI